MSRHPGLGLASEVGGRDRRVVQEAQLVVVSWVGFEEIILVRETDADGYRSKDDGCSLVTLPVEFGGELAKAGKHVFG